MRVKDFDPTTVIEKRDVRKTDMYTIFALAAAREAVEDSGIIGTVEPTRLGSYIGAGIGGLYTFYENAQGMIEKGPRKVSPHFIPKMIGNIATGQVAIKYDAKGPSLSTMSACASGSNSVGEAFHAVKDGYADAVIAGGAECVVHPLTIAGFANMKALSTTEDPKKASIPFDVKRNGFVMGEGAGVLILEEYEHAKARGAKIYAEMIGYGNTCDAHHVTAPDPEGEGLAQAIRVSFAEGNVTDRRNRGDCSCSGSSRRQDSADNRHRRARPRMRPRLHTRSGKGQRHHSCREHKPRLRRSRYLSRFQKNLTED